MKSAHQTPSQHTSLKAYVRTLVLVWTACASVSLSWNLHQQTLDTLEVARTEARMSYEKDAIYRIWNARHGGVYVPVSEKTPPNPYLEEIERDIRTPWGVTLTRVNPAYMIRQVNEMELKAFGIQSHLTSLKPIRPENAPDPWERAGLKTFQEGAQEVSSQEKMAGETYMRLMRPLRMEQGCLKCHAAQGYKVGDVRGGISVSIPMSPLWALARSHRVTLTFAHGILWALGIAGICIGSTGLRKQIEDRKRAEGRLRKVNLELENKNRQLAEAIERVRGMALETEKAYKELNQIFNTAVDGMCVIDKEFNVLRINRTFSEMSGMEEAYAVEKKCYELFGSELCEKGRCPLKRILAGEEYVEDELDMEWADGRRVPYLLTATAFRNGGGSLVGIVENFKDVTAYRQAEGERLQREKLQGVLEMAGAVCHELNQPMQSVLTCSEILLLRVPKEDPAHKRIQALTEQITRMGEITWKLMKITKYETKDYAGTAKIIDIDRASDEPVALPAKRDKIASG